MSNYPQILLKAAFASLGDKTLPPQTPAQAGTGRFSQEQGFGEINSTPLADGGIPPFREDINGAFFLLSQFILWQQQGGLMNWVSTLSYEPGNEVLHNGTKYRCIQACTNIAPPNRAYWKNLDVSVRAGMVVPAYNVTVDATGHPIWWGDSVADEGFLLCDGRSDGLGGTVPNLVDRFIRGSLPADAGQTGGADSVQLSVANLPAHSHGVAVSTDGAHTHYRGSMNITGGITIAAVGGDKTMIRGTSGAFSHSGEYAGGYGQAARDKESWSDDISFNAANAWTGETSLNGAHSHSVTISNTGSGTAVDIKPSFYTMAFFIKLPE